MSNIDMAVALLSETVHATSIAIEGRALLLAGKSGSGKSDLGLRLIDRGAQLISDDYTVLTREGPRLIANPPATIAGKMEIRGIGIVDMPFIRDIPVALIIDLTPSVQRHPMKETTRILSGISVRMIALSPFEVSAAVKAEWALRTFGL